MNDQRREGQPCTDGACAGGPRGLGALEPPAFGPAVPVPEPIFRIPCFGILPAPDGTRTNPKYLFLREIGGAGCLKAFLDQVSITGKGGLHWGGTLILDEIVNVSEPITIPSDFTLAGVGTNGTGGLKILLALKGTAVSFAPGGNSVLRDLNIEGENGISSAAGIHITGNTGPIYLDGVRVAGFQTGLRGFNATSVYISNSTFDNCGDHIVLTGKCTHWRIRDSDIRKARNTGIRILGPGAEDTLIQGCQFEEDGKLFPPLGVAAIDVQNCFGTFIFGSRFEHNGATPGLSACVRVANTLAVDPNGVATRFLCNYTSSDQPRPGDFNEKDAMNKPTWPRLGDAVQLTARVTQTQIGFNSTSDWGSQGLDPNFPMDHINAPEE